MQNSVSGFQQENVLLNKLLPHLRVPAPGLRRSVNNRHPVFVSAQCQVVPLQSSTGQATSRCQAVEVSARAERATT